MGTVPEKSILDALRGYSSESLKLPTPRLVKIYISSTKNGKWSWIAIEIQFGFVLNSLKLYSEIPLEFKEERRVLLEVIGPELQSIFDDRQIEVFCFAFENNDSID
jgi:NACHT domain- and WD repeat-containing protein